MLSVYFINKVYCILKKDSGCYQKLVSVDRFSGDLTFEEHQSLRRQRLCIGRYKISLLGSNIQSAFDYCKKINPKINLKKKWSLETKTATVLGYKNSPFCKQLLVYIVLGDEALILQHYTITLYWTFII